MSSIRADARLRETEPAAVQRQRAALDTAQPWQLSPRLVAQRQMLAQRFGPAVFTPGDGVAQCVSKRTKNVLSLGIRKAYVEIKRAVRNHQAAGGGGGGAGVIAPLAPVVPQATEEDRFAEAYGKSRHYHSTLDEANLPKIERHGLLNQADRVKTFGQDVVGYSTQYRDSEYQGDEKKGVFVATRRHVAENLNMLSHNAVRAFLPSDRTEKVSESEADHDNMFRDRNFPGEAYITRGSIGPELVTAEAMLDLLDAGNAKVDSILAAIATQYDDPATAPSLAEMKRLLRQAIQTRRLSNAALDNLA